MTNCCSKSCQLLGDFTFERGKMSRSWDELIDGSGTSTWINDGYVEMKVLSQNDRVVRQTKKYFPSRTHKLKKCTFTCVLNMINDSGYTSRIGTFDNHNDKTTDVGGSGFFFEYTDNVLYVGIRYGTIDNGVDTIISQTNFNANNLMRNSHLSINEWTKVYTFEITFNSIGYVEWAVYLDGERLIIHIEQDISRVLNTLPRYNLPLRLEIIKNDNDAGATTGELRQFNTAICYEIGYSLEEKTTGNQCMIKHLSGLSSIAFNITTTNYKPMFSIKLKDTFIRNPILAYELLYMINKPGSFMYAIVKNPSFTNLQPVWIDPNSNCSLEYDTTTDEVDINNLDIIFEEFIFSNCNIGAQTQTSLLDKLCFPAISSDICGASDIYTIVAKKMTPQNVVLRFNFRWME